MQCNGCPVVSFPCPVILTEEGLRSDRLKRLIRDEDAGSFGRVRVNPTEDRQDGNEK
jgi:hypothetical protein